MSFFSSLALSPSLPSRSEKRERTLLLSSHLTGASPLLDTPQTAAVMVKREREQQGQGSGSFLSPFAFSPRHRWAHLPLFLSLSVFSLPLLATNNDAEHLQQPGPDAGRDHPARPGHARGRLRQAEGRREAAEFVKLELGRFGDGRRHQQRRRARAAATLLQRGPDRRRGETGEENAISESEWREKEWTEKERNKGSIIIIIIVIIIAMVFFPSFSSVAALAHLSLSSLLFSPNKTPSLTQIRVTPPPGKRLEHAGIKVRLIGRVELPSDRGGKHEFVSLVRDLSPPGELGAPVRWRECF